MPTWTPSQKFLDFQSSHIRSKPPKNPSMPKSAHRYNPHIPKFRLIKLSMWLAHCSIFCLVALELLWKRVFSANRSTREQLFQQEWALERQGGGLNLFQKSWNTNKINFARETNLIWFFPSYCVYIIRIQYSFIYIYHGPPKPTCLEVFMVNNFVFRWPKPLFFMVLGAHGIYIYT